MIKVEHKIIDGVELKRCGSGEWLPLDRFNNSKDTSDGLYNHCIACCAIKRKNRRLKNLEHQRDKDREYTSTRREVRGDRVREIERNRRKNFTEEQRIHLREWTRHWRSTNLTVRLNGNIASMVRKRIKTPALGTRTFEDVFGYSRNAFIVRIEDTFKEGMSWENYGFGKGKWAIDHIRPSASFSFTTYDDPEFRLCWALDNLQALWNEENMSKNSNYEGVRYFYSNESKIGYEQKRRVALLNTEC